MAYGSHAPSDVPLIYFGKYVLGCRPQGESLQSLMGVVLMEPQQRFGCAQYMNPCLPLNHVVQIFCISYFGIFFQLSLGYRQYAESCLSLLAICFRHMDTFPQHVFLTELWLCIIHRNIARIVGQM